MKKIVSLLLALMLLMSIAPLSFAEAAAEDPIKESASGFYYIEAEGDRPRLSAQDKSLFIQVDGQWYKDLNKNGALDVYENWAAPIAERVNDLLSQMTVQEKAGVLAFACVAGNNGSTVTDFGNTGGEVTGFADSPTSGNVINPAHPAITGTDPIVTTEAGNFVGTAYQIQTMGVSTFIAAFTGTAKDQLNVFNTLQGIAEASRLGIPAVFSGDRSYNTWGGMIDMAHYAFGVAHDEELLYNLVSEYAKEAVAIGYHQVFHGYGNEIGSFYGDDVNYIAIMSAIETRAYDDNGFNSHSKHFIARGGRSGYSSARSDADLIDSWKVGWQAVIDAGTQWIMTNNGEARTKGLQGYMDYVTYNELLRGELGYEGIVCLDWPLDASSIMSKTGITADGKDVSTMTLTERYALILNAGVDMFSCYGAFPGTDIEAYTECSNRYFPDVVVEAVNTGLVTAEDLDMHAGRVLKNKFDLGIFEDPFSDWGEALEIIGSDAYKAVDGNVVPMNNDEINLYRRSEIVAMEEELMVKSTILFKNDDVLPLAEGTKIYADSNNASIKESDAAALAAYGTVVSTFEEADVVIFHATSLDENYEYAVEDAEAAGKPIILIFEGTNSSEPSTSAVLECDAVLMQTYVNTPDHGSSVGSYFRYTTGSVTADMLFGKVSPAGSTIFEIGYDSEASAEAWGELQQDIGVDAKTRLWMAGLVRENPTVEVPNNLGDVLFTTDYGMTYGLDADIVFELLTVPTTIGVEEVDMGSSKSTQTSVVNATLKAGEPFEIYFLATNHGEGDGHELVEVTANGEVIASKFVSLDAGAYRVITIELVLPAGQYDITVAGMTETLVVE